MAALLTHYTISRSFTNMLVHEKLLSNTGSELTLPGNAHSIANFFARKMVVVPLTVSVTGKGKTRPGSPALLSFAALSLGPVDRDRKPLDF